MAEIRWSVKAARDLQAIEDYIARDSPLYAVHFINRLVAAAERLQTHALRGRVVPEYGRQDLRELIFRSYRIVYVVEGKQVSIARVVHASRDFTKTLGRKPWSLR
jgi:addiction module RelE/StbE family toxin